MAAFCGPGRVHSSRVCPAKGGVHIVHSFVHGRLSTCIVVASSWFCLHYFMQFSVSGDMTLRLRPSVS
jgi:hypothetical protein